MRSMIESTVEAATFVARTTAVRAAIFVCACVLACMGCMQVVQPAFADEGAYEITSEPQSVIVSAGETAQLSVETNDGAATYLWQHSSDYGNTWRNCAGATASTYAIEADSAAAGDVYRSIVTFADGTQAVSATAMAAEEVAAEIDGKGQFATLQAAFNAAEDGDTIRLLADVKEDITGTDASVTLDLNSHCIGELTAGNQRVVALSGAITSGTGTITIMSSEDVARGCIQVDGVVKGNILIINGTFFNNPRSYVDEGSTRKLETNYVASIDQTVSYYRVAKHVHTLLKYAAECGDRYYYQCSCGAVFADAEGTIPASLDDYRHKLEYVEEVPGSCTESGIIEHYKCTVCGCLFADQYGKEELTEEDIVEPARGHWIDHVDATDPTCTQEGSSEYWYCLRCGAVYKDEAGTQPTTLDEVTIPALGHDWGEYEQTLAPTCTEEGTEERVCARCGEVESQAIPALGHEMTKVEAVESTCSVQGNNEYYVCSRCGGVYCDEEGKIETTVEAQTLPLAACVLGKYEAREATCTLFGCIEHYECINCGKFYKINDDGSRSLVDRSEVVTQEALGHKMKFLATEAATCTSQGLKEHYYCMRCEKNFTDEAGENQVKASDLAIAALGHDLIDHPATASTTTVHGNYEYYTCSRCMIVLKADKMTETTVAAETIALKVLPSDDDDDGYDGSDDDSDVYPVAGIASDDDYYDDEGDVADGTAVASSYPDVVVDDDGEEADLDSSTANSNAAQSTQAGLSDFMIFLIVCGVILVVVIALIVVASILMRKGKLNLPFMKKQPYAATNAAALASENRASEAASPAGNAGKSVGEGMTFSFAKPASQA